ncbi:MAG: hypothetical protein FJX23_03450 [Alphaproteobacteria bacterium]|nr:hypothetical protein [Alphaproteobacteria bacterium]
MSRILAGIALLLLLPACGFQAIYGKSDDTNIEIGTYLASTTVNTRGSGELGNRLKIAVEDRLNPTAAASLYGKAFNLEIRVTAPRTPLGIGRSGAISRYDVTLQSSYVLSDAETREVLDKGVITRRVSFFNADEKFASYAAEQDAIDRGINELGEDYKIRLAAYFAEHYKLSIVAD